MSIGFKKTVAFVFLYDVVIKIVIIITSSRISFRCTNGDFHVALGSSMNLARMVWVGGGRFKEVLYFFDNEHNCLGQKSPMLHLPQEFETPL